MEQVIEYHLYDGEYGVIRLNRPHKRNAISREMSDLLNETIVKAKEDPIKCLVVTGAGSEMFCAGGDLSELHSGLNTDQAFSMLYPMKDVLYELASFPVPTVCLLNGNAVGGGCELATACDFRFAREDTEFGFVQSTLGIAPGWGGGTLLYEKIDQNFAYQWLVEGTTYPASVLKEKGWVHHIYSTDDMEYLLRPYLARSREQMLMFKRQFSNKLAMLSLSAQMNEDVRAAATLWGNSLHQQALKLFSTKKQD